MTQTVAHTTQTTTQPAGSINVKMAPYNAAGDGLNDDTAAIRSAIATGCSNGGATLYFPKGTYVISPQASSDLGALIVPCDNISFTGDGIGISVLSRKTIGDTDPDASCPMSGKDVNRGSGIYVTAKTDGDKIRKSFHLDSLSLLGNRKKFTGSGGRNIWPATQVDCFNVWDISDKGLYVQQDHDSADIQVTNSEIAYFSGELVYGGSMHSPGWLFSNSDLHHSNGDAISVFAGAVISNNKLHDLAADGIENQPYGTGEPQTVTGNEIYNVQLDGINILMYYKSFYDGPVPVIDISSNVITSVNRFGVILLSRGGNIHDNQIYDSGINNPTGCGIGLIGWLDKGTWQVPQNIAVTSNVIQAKKAITNCGIEVYSPAEAGVPAMNIAIGKNSIGHVQASSSATPHIGTAIFVAAGAVSMAVTNNSIW